MIKILELFGGIGACSKALENLGIEHEIVDCVENDKYAINSFNAIHGTNFEPQDIIKWDKDIECDLIMHGSPCQDFSIAGKQAGGDKDSGTRSSLMYETLRIVEKLKPKYVIWENVKNILSKRHVHNWDAYNEFMENLGYVTYCNVMNAKDYGIPQNRERVFTISIKPEGKFLNLDYRVPKPIPLTKKLKDFLEVNVDEKYYLSQEKIDMISKWKCYEKPLGHILTEDSICGTLTTRSGAECGGMKTIAIKTANKTGYDLAYPDSKTRRGRVGHGVAKTLPTSDSQGVIELNKTPKHQQDLIQHENGLCRTIPAGSHGSTPHLLKTVTGDYRIRKLTPKECWRLMGFADEDFKKAARVNSNTQLYKQAGNSIVVNVLEAILNNLLKEEII